MERSRMRTLGLAALLIAASCASPPATIVLDPEDNPAVRSAGEAAAAQPGPTGAPPVPLSLPALKADFVRAAGSDTVMFTSRDTYALDAAAQAILTRQATWLRANPFVRANIEGHADGRQSREHALALGERRASAVRNFLLAQGVAPEQLTVVSWGKERPATSVVHDATWLQNSRVVTVLVLPPQPLLPPPPPPLPPVD